MNVSKNSMLKIARRVESLFIIGDYDKNLYLSSRNLEGVKVVNASELSTYEIMNASEVVLSEGAVEKVTAILS